jgi:hypothetical protein
MNTIIAGRFDESARAERAISALEAAGFQRANMTTFFVNAAGQHDLSGTTGDPQASAGAHNAGAGAAAGAAAGTGVGAVVALATLPVLGPGAALVGVAIGAYVGSLTGALEEMGNPDRPAGDSAIGEPGKDESLPRKAGMLVAIGTPTSTEEGSAIAILTGQGAADIERAQGTITESLWNDFDPLDPPALVRYSVSARVAL